MRHTRFAGYRTTALAALIALTMLIAGTSASAQTFTVLHAFHNYTDNGKCCGGYPYSTLTFDAAGNLYGTTEAFGTGGSGTAFELGPVGAGSWKLKTLHNFGITSSDGQAPVSGMTFDAAGNLYGTTTSDGLYGAGTLYELSPTSSGGWARTILHHFNPNNNKDGYEPWGGVVVDSAGNIFGTTVVGGASGWGTVYEFSRTASGGLAETILHNFNSNATDGRHGWGKLLMDTAGNLYGTTSDGGAYGGGTVFELQATASGGFIEKILHSFAITGDGNYPFGDLMMDASGNLYGTTVNGGRYGWGTVFELVYKNGSWSEALLYTFSGTDGGAPRGGVVQDATGNLYGTTWEGCSSGYGCVYKLAPGAGGTWTQTILHTFTSWNGDGPQSTLLLDAAGNLYGSAPGGGPYSGGMVFEIKP